MAVELIPITSFVLQIVVVFFALRLIRVAGIRAAGILITLGLVFMVLQRISPFLSIQARDKILILNDWISILVTLLLIAGLFLIASSTGWSKKTFRDSEKSYKTLVKYIDVGLFRCTDNLQGNFIQANPAIAKMLGYKSFDEFMRIPLSVHFKNKEDGEIFIRTLKSNNYVKDEEIELQKKDGNSIMVSITASAQYDKQGRIKWIAGLIEDITERKQVELKLIESEERLRRVIQGSPIATFVIGKDHKIIYWNKAQEELTGIKSEEAVGTNQQWKSFYRTQRPCLADLLVDGALEAIPTWYSGKYIKSKLLEEAYEARDFFPDIGESGRWLRFTAALIRDSRGEIVGAIETLEDITERKQAEEELIRMRKLESLGIFASGIAHDFNNLLSVILRNIFTAKLSLGDTEESPEHKLDLAEKAGFQAKELAHHLIIFAKGGEPVRKVGSLSELLRDSVDLALSDSNVRCNFAFPDDLWQVEMDDVQIRQVIHNLVTHAREAMHGDGTIEIEAENVYLTTHSNLPLKEGRYVKWFVRDHGVGIPTEDLQRIFDPYFSTKPSGSTRGMELGLAICYAIVNRHEGFITVESTPGVGSTFYVYLPVSLQAGDRIGDGGVHTGGRKILVAADDESLRYATEIVLNFLGYSVECAKNGHETTDLYKKAMEQNQRFAAVIMDINIPEGLGAKELIKELLIMDPEVKAILSTGYRDDPVVREFKECGFRDIIAVPYDLDGIKDVLNKALN